MASCGGDDDAASDTADTAADTADADVAATDVAVTAAAATADATASTEPPGAAEPPAATEPADQAPATTATPEAPAGAIDACILLTSEDAAAALGGPVDPPIPGTAGPFSQCIWRIAGGTELDSAAIAVQALGGVSPDQFAQLVEEYAPAELGPVEPVAGVGDEAYQQDGLMVRSGDAMVVVTVISTDPAGDRARQVSVAQAAVARLP